MNTEYVSPIRGRVFQITTKQHPGCFTYSVSNEYGHWYTYCDGSSLKTRADAIADAQYRIDDEEAQMVA